MGCPSMRNWDTNGVVGGESEFELAVGVVLCLSACAYGAVVCASVAARNASIAHLQ